MKCGGSEKESLSQFSTLGSDLGLSYFDVRENYSDFSYSLLAFAHTVESKKGTKIRWSRIARGGGGGHFNMQP